MSPRQALPNRHRARSPARQHHRDRPLTWTAGGPFGIGSGRRVSATCPLEQSPQSTLLQHHRAPSLSGALVRDNIGGNHMMKHVSEPHCWSLSRRQRWPPQAPRPPRQAEQQRPRPNSITSFAIPLQSGAPLRPRSRLAARRSLSATPSTSRAQRLTQRLRRFARIKSSLSGGAKELRHFEVTPPWAGEVLFCFRSPTLFASPPPRRCEGNGSACGCRQGAGRDHSRLPNSPDASWDDNSD